MTLETVRQDTPAKVTVTLMLGRGLGFRSKAPLP